ncbi:MAG: uracil-DNA glycosylase family protein [Chromatocurvus sp.]
MTWFEPAARILVIGQAPGMRVHDSGTPFLDRSGDRLRQWMGVDEATFYDRSRIAIVPMAFCFPGYSASGADLPPPRICAKTWHDQVMALLPKVQLTLLIGGYAQRRYLQLPATATVTQTVANWRQSAPEVMPLPHPSWRNSGWLKRHPWFETDLLPVLRQHIASLL